MNTDVLDYLNSHDVVTIPDQNIPRNIESLLYDIIMLDPNDFVKVNMNDIKIGDIVKSTVTTYSQKYMFDPNYAQYNMTKYGVFLKKCDEDSCDGDSIISQIMFTDDKTVNLIKTNFYADPGNHSGWIDLHKYNKL